MIERDQDSSMGFAFASEASFLDGENAPKSLLREFLTFAVGHETYGLDLRCLREIMRLPELTELPRAESFLRGILSLRGTMVPVVDLRSRLKLGRTETTSRSRVLVVEYAGDLVGLIVDAVKDVARIAEDDVELPPSTLGNQEVTHIAGIGRYRTSRGESSNNAIVVLLSLESLMRFELRWARPTAMRSAT